MTVNKQTKSTQQAHKRLVVFVGGFDPRGARHYHQLMRKEAAKQSEVAGVRYQVGPRERWRQTQGDSASHAVWTVSAAEPTASSSDYVFFDWSDLVRGHWPKHTWQVMKEAWPTYAAVASVRTTLPPLHRETPYVLWTLAYPLAYMLLWVALALAVFTSLFVASPNVLGCLTGCVAAAVVLGAGYKLDKWLHVSWLLRILNFARQSAQQPVDGLQARCKQAADGVAKQLQQGNYCEVVVLGFSVGSVVAIPLVRALRERLQQTPAGPQRVSLLTLGNCIPLFTLMPQVNVGLRQQLLALAQDPEVLWADISSPSDSVSFGMCNLVALSLPHTAAATVQQCVNPRHMCSPRFHKLFSAASYRWLRRNKMRMHFQYLMAAERPGAYDFFALLTYRGQLMDFISKRLVR